MNPDLSWAPKRSVFLRRNLIVALLTFAGLCAAGIALSVFADLPFLWSIPVALILTLGFAFDDALRWRSVRYDRWQISDGHLIHDGSDGKGTIPLSEIDRVFTRFGNRVILQLSSGQRVALRYLPFPKDTAAQINAAISPR